MVVGVVGEPFWRIAMRINVYSQELTDEVKMVEKKSNTGVVYHAAQIILHWLGSLGRHHRSLVWIDCGLPMCIIYYPL